MVAIDRNEEQASGSTLYTLRNIMPASHAVVIEPDDDTDLEYITRTLYIGGDGDLAVKMAGGEEVVFVGMLAGTLLPIQVVRVLNTGTTASNIVGLD